MSKVRLLPLILMLIAVFAPLPLGIIARFGPEALRDLLHDAAPLVGQSAGPRPLPTVRDVASRRFQRDLEAVFATIVYPYKAIVRLTNELYFAAFTKSYMYRGALIAGRDGSLFEKAYIGSYCSGRTTPASMTRLVAGLKALQASLSRIDRHVVFLTTPSKAVTMAEWLPATGCDGPLDPAGNSETFVAQLRDAGIPVVDGAAMTRAMKPLDPLPTFTPGGTHWSILAASRVGQRLIEEINRTTGKDLGGYDLERIRWDAQPVGTDIDLAQLLNVYNPPVNFVTGQAGLRCRQTPDGAETRLIAVGGSFFFGAAEPFQDCRLFRQIDVYFYYRSLITMGTIGRTPIDRKLLDWRAILAEKSVIVMELNEVALIGSDPPTFLDPFLDDVLAALR